jgi:microcystin degradation protein MlrC
VSQTLFFSSLMAETSSFTNLPTTYCDFAPGLLRGEACLRDEAGGPRPGMAPLLDFAEARAWQVRAGITCHASVGAPVLHRDYVRLRDELIASARAARPDAVALLLHGAMMSGECEDCEGDILARLRAEVGPEVPIVAVLDPHAHLTPAMVAQADLLVFMKEYPHTDGAERLREALAIAARMLDEGLRPMPAVVDCRLLGFFPTHAQPMRGLVDRLQAIERRPGVLSLSFVHGFPWGDMPEAGAKVLAYAEREQNVAQQVAEEVDAAVQAIRDATMPTMLSIAQAITLARQPGPRPLVLADVADNPGGGAPSDSTFLLRALIEAGVGNVALGLLYDPEAVRICHQVGPGARVLLRVGGKTGPASGDPVDCDVEVMALCTAAEMRIGDDASFPMGDTAWVRAHGIDIILCSIRVQLYHPDGFAHLGIDPAARDVLVVKSTNHFRAFFSGLAGEIHLVATPGAIDFDFRRLPYRRLTRPVYPLVADPFADEAQ